MNDMELICFQIISNSGTAKSSYIEAIQKAKQKDFEAAEKLIAEGQECFTQAHHIHSELLQKDASGEHPKFSLILMHAEDQMANSEMAYVMAKEIIELYKKLN